MNDGGKRRGLFCDHSAKKLVNDSTAQRQKTTSYQFSFAADWAFPAAFAELERCSMNIRPASVSDADRVLTFLHEFRAEGLPTVLQHNTSPTLEEERAFINKLSGSAGVMLIALKEDRVVGCLTAETATHGQLCHSCEFAMGVLRTERGRGIGTALTSRLSEWAKAMGMRRIQLKVFARNAGALRFYHRLGYAVEGTRRQAIKIGDSYEDLIEMAKTTVHGDAA